MSDKNTFGRELARYLVADQTRMSVLLQMNDPRALQWARLRGATPLRGYPTVEEAQKTLAAWFGVR